MKVRPVRLVTMLIACSLPGWGSCPADGTGPDDAFQVLVKSHGPLTPEAISAIAAHGTRVVHVWPEIDAMAMRVRPEKVGELVADPLVAFMEADRQAGTEWVTADPAVAQPSLDATTVPLSTTGTPIQTWNLSMARTAGTGYDGTGVTVAVIDSGLPQNWEEFLPPGSVDLEHAAGFGSPGWGGDYWDPVNAVRGVGGHIGLLPHGLAVSGVIVGFPAGFGPVAGAAPGAKILPIRVLGQFNFGWFSSFTSAILYVGRLKAGGDLPGPVVINFSIQAVEESFFLSQAIDYAIAQGVVFVTIAGNFGPSPGSIAYPGWLPQAITAGAVGWRRAFSSPQWFLEPVPPDDPSEVYVAGFSGREFAGDPPAGRIDVVAPGSLVIGEWVYGPGFSDGRQVARDYVSYFIDGTSFAAPHVTGIVAQMLQKNPGLTQSQVEEILRSTALAIPAAVGDPAATGRGLAQGVTAVAATPAP